MAFTLIGGDNWTGGRNYLVNLLRVIAVHQRDRITPLLFVDSELPPEKLVAFTAIPGVELVRTRAISAKRSSRRLLAALLFGYDFELRNEFVARATDVVFEAAQYFGWRIGIPAIAWIPDFQHRALPKLFSRVGLLKRELGFRAQVYSDRTIMLSSEHARRACELYYPCTVGRTFTVRFSVPAVEGISEAEARQVADHYALPKWFFFMPNQFWQHKNHMLVLEALSILKDRGIQVVVAVTGRQSDPRNPHYFGNVLAKIERRALGSVFRILGMVPHDHVTSLMISGMAVLNPSCYEGWSTTVEEARSLGTPLVLSDIAVHREQAGDAATYFGSNDSLGLAAALESFEPLSSESRKSARILASNAAVTRARRFSEDFVNVARRSLDQGSARRNRV